MGSRIRSSLLDGEHQFREQSDSGNEPHRWNGLKRGGSLKRKLLRLPARKREEARQRTLTRSPLRRESKGRKAEVAKYNASAAAFFAEPGNDVCHICIVLRESGEDILLQKATERHHRQGRSGRLLNWRPGWIPCCRSHRLFPHEHPARARALGLLCAPQDWNRFPSSGNGALK